MKATYQDFLQENPTCAKYADDITAQGLFDLLSTDSNILAMLDASGQGKPALYACVRQIEEFLTQNPSPIFDVKDNSVRQTVGCMVKTILRPFGYRVTKQKNLPKNSGEYFASASCYALTAPEEATMRVVKKIEEV